MDEIDSRIILELQKDGRRSSYQLAKDLGLSVATVARRINKLVENVVTIQAIPVESLTNNQVKIILGMKVDSDKIDFICDKLSNYPQITFIQTVFGIYDILSRANFNSVTEINEFAKGVSQITGIRQSWLFIINEIKKTYNTILLSKDKASDTPIRIDETDKQIIAKLEKDGRSSFKNLAKELGLSSTTIARRYKNLAEMGIFKVSAVPKIKIGELPDAIVFINADTSKINNICSRLVNYSNIYMVETCFGLFDMVVSIQSVNQRELHSLIKNEILTLPGVTSTDTVFLGEFKKT